MKKDNSLKKKSLKIVLLLSLVGILAVGGTLAVYTAMPEYPVENTFDLLTHSTEIEEEIEEGSLNKKLSIVNVTPDPVYVRMRILVSPNDAPVTLDVSNLLANGWAQIAGDEEYYYYVGVADNVNGGALQGVNSAAYKTPQGTLGVTVDQNYREPFEIIVYEESCVANGTLNDASKIAEIFNAIEEGKLSSEVGN